ncbi:MAG: DUF167 domain-containing protein [Nitrososphaerales archaeon]
MRARTRSFFLSGASQYLQDYDSIIKGMLIRVSVTSNSKKASVTKISETELEVRVDEAAVQGRANKRLVEILSTHFNVPKSKIRIVRGAKSRDKIVDVP